MRTLGQSMYKEISYWSNRDETVVGFIAYDKNDGDYLYGIFMRDSIGRYRATYVEINFAKEKLAKKAMRGKIREITASSDTEYSQGDKPNSYIDLLSVTSSAANDQLDSHFIQLTQNPAYAPASRVFAELSPWLHPKDKHLEKEFQRQFDQRLWEIYLWAALKELMFDVEQLEAPDFLCKWGNKSLFTIEATTVARSESGKLAQVPDVPKDQETLAEYSEYMAMKFGSSLRNKLNKTPPYWEKTKARGLPFVLAIADFHRSEDDTWLPAHPNMLSRYLYGYEALVTRDSDGRHQIQSEPIDKHKYLEKEIPSGFFNLPKAENISAVLFSNAGTLPKFTRMGVLAGFKSPDYQYVRQGMKYNVADPLATEGIPVEINISAKDYAEKWSEEMHLFHNPNAKHRLPVEYFAHINQHFSKGDHIESKIHPTWIHSTTVIIKNP